MLRNIRFPLKMIMGSNIWPSEVAASTTVRWHFSAVFTKLFLLPYCSVSREREVYMYFASNGCYLQV